MAILSRVLAKRGEPDTILKGDAANGERLEEFGNRTAVGLRVKGLARDRDLFWCVVRDVGSARVLDYGLHVGMLSSVVCHLDIQ